MVSANPVWLKARRKVDANDMTLFVESCAVLQQCYNQPWHGSSGAIQSVCKHNLGRLLGIVYLTAVSNMHTTGLVIRAV